MHGASITKNRDSPKQRFCISQVQSCFFSNERMRARYPNATALNFNHGTTFFPISIVIIIAVVVITISGLWGRRSLQNELGEKRMREER